MKKVKEATATISVIVEVTSQIWDGNSTVEAIYDKSAKQAVKRLQGLLTGIEGIKVIGDPEVQIVTSAREVIETPEELEEEPEV